MPTSQSIMEWFQNTLPKSRLATGYKRLFAIGEIEESPILQWFFGGSLFFFFITFGAWINSPRITIETARRGDAVCWPYFQNCADLYFLHKLPEGYSQTVLYMVFYVVMMLIVWCMWQKRWSLAHILLTLLLLWKIFVVMVRSYLIAGPYDYYHIFLTAVLLFVPFKEFFLKLMFVCMYFMAATTKIDETWILGTYFTSLKTGLPLFPDSLTPLFTNLVIFMQIVGAWFLLSSRILWQRLALWYFLIFHWYSGILVLYRYPSASLIALIILFGPLYRYTPIPFNKKAAAGWCLIALLVGFQALGFISPGDRRISLENNRYGMFMFEANHQCVTTTETHTTRAPEDKVGTDVTRAKPGASCSGFECLVETRTSVAGNTKIIERRYESSSAWNRCDPYIWWSKLHTACDAKAARIAMREDHSIDGGPFYRIVDVPNICDVTYRPFTRNAWIRLPPEAPIVGYPVENIYRY